MLLQLLRRPQETIPALLAEDPRPWLVPITGYFCVSFAEGYERVASRTSAWPAVATIVVAGIVALVIGSLVWAAGFGGALHLSSRLLRGEEGMSDTVRAVGYAFYWPGLLAVAAVVTMALLGYRGGELPLRALLPALVQGGAGLWAVYTVIAALRARHRFGWWRSIAAYLLPFLVLVAAVAVFVVANAPAS